MQYRVSMPHYREPVVAGLAVILGKTGYFRADSYCIESGENGHLRCHTKAQTGNTVIA
jgi:hypothetical protein